MEYKKEQKDLELKRRKDSILLRDQLVQMRNDIRRKAEKEREKDAEEYERIQAWVNRKNRQSELKKEIERKWFEYVAPVCTSHDLSNL
jgi:ubiquinone/menaquinone biosynthesis C-methylase UbiE